MNLFLRFALALAILASGMSVLGGQREEAYKRLEAAMAQAQQQRAQLQKKREQALAARGRIANDQSEVKAARRDLGNSAAAPQIDYSRYNRCPNGEPWDNCNHVEHKQEWLPGMAAGDLIGCFGLTEPDFGSDPAGMRTNAKRDGGDWLLNGTKMWITNGSVADVAVVWAQTDEGIRGFVVPTNTPGFSAPVIKSKLSLRASVTSELVLENVRLPADAVFPDVRGLKGPLSALSEARFGIVWGVVGAARDCLETAISYAQDREQFGKPIAAFQLTQKKLADMALELDKAFLLALHLGRLKDDHRVKPEMISVGKLNNVREAIEIARTSRTILGGNGITLEYPVLRHANNLESVLTYEGTEEIHTLVVGQALTGEAAYR